MDYRVFLIAPLAAVVLSVSAASPRMPTGWLHTAVATTADPKSAGHFGYEVGVDPASEAGGSPSLMVHSVVPLAATTPSVGAAYQTASGYGGQRVRFSGQLRATAPASWAGLYLGVGDHDLLSRLTLGRPGAEKQLPPGAAVPAVDGAWHDVSVVLDVPADAPIINLGLALVGEGQVWARGLRFEVVGAEVPATQTTVAIDVLKARQFYAQSRAQMAKVPPQPLTNPALD